MNLGFIVYIWKTKIFHIIVYLLLYTNNYCYFKTTLKSTAQNNLLGKEHYLLMFLQFFVFSPTQESKSQT